MTGTYLKVYLEKNKILMKNFEECSEGDQRYVIRDIDIMISKIRDNK